MAKKSSPPRQRAAKAKPGTGPRNSDRQPSKKVADVEPPSPAHDHLVRAFKLFTARQIKESLQLLNEAATLFPKDSAVRENLGVLHIRLGDVDAAIAELNRALELGGKNANLHDALCSALGKKGNMAEAGRHGRLALESKDRKFGARPPICALPKEPAPAFNAGVRAGNVIAYCLWGSNPRYVFPLQENLKIARHLFPAWTLRIYHDATVPQELLATFRQSGADLKPMQLPKGDPPHRRLLWRFHVWSDPGVKRFLVRDADSIFSVKERVAVDDWLASGRYFHTMRDYFTHTDLVLAGMFGGVGGILPPVDTLMKDFKPFRLEGDHIDQDFLSDRMWPTIRKSCLIHDSVFTGCLGSKPFPPYGALPAHHHVGQNAFIHFRKGPAAAGNATQKRTQRSLK